MSAPLVSVIVRCYSQGEFVTEAVESIRRQTVQDFEILIVNDGSTDAITPAVLDSASSLRTQIVHTANRGMAEARNFVISKSGGEYLCVLDAGTSMASRYFEATLEAFRQDPGLTFVGTRRQILGAETPITPVRLECDLQTLLVDCPLSPATLVRRTAIAEHGGYDTAVPGHEDWDLWISLLERGHRGVILPDVLVNHRRHPGSLCDVCPRGEDLEPKRYLIRKHQTSYRLHLPHVLSTKQAGMQHRQAAIDALTRQIEASRIEPNDAAIRNAREVETLRHEYARAVAEIAALKTSLSWRMTAPLRFASELAGIPQRSSLNPDAPPSTEDDQDVERLLMSYETMFMRQGARLEQLQDELRELERRHQTPRDLRAAAHAIDWGDLRRCTPVSAVWGTDRGRPLDRYYIEGFLDRHREDIKGSVLEVKDPGYTQKFGEHRVSTSDVIDIDAANACATLIADLAGSHGIGSRRFDCIILTQTLGLIFDVRAALSNVAAALKPAGVLLCTLPASGRISYEPPGLDGDFWRFTEASTRRLFAGVFTGGEFTITTFGNVLARAAFEYGLADHELSPPELDVMDPYFPVIYGVRAVRTWP